VPGRSPVTSAPPAGGRPPVVFAFTVDGGRITGIDLVAGPERLGRLELTVLDEGPVG